MANEMQKTTPFGMRDKVGYMFGDFANDFTFILSSSFLMKFYTDVMGVSAGVTAMAMASPSMSRVRTGSPTLLNGGATTRRARMRARGKKKATIQALSSVVVRLIMTPVNR